MAKKRQMSLENAMILSLIIGIVIVVITLIVARPAPEKFTQLYINDFKSLPKFLSQGETTNFSVTINNLERTNLTYNYTLTKELYKLNYCNQPRLYISENETHTYHLDPAQIIKDNYYELEFKYKPRSKDPIVEVLFGDKYQFIFDEENDIIYMNTEEKNLSVDFDFEMFKQKQVLIIHDNQLLQLFIDYQHVADFDLNMPFTKGYFDFKIVQGLVTFHGITTRQPDNTIDYVISNTDYEYKSTNLKKLKDVYTFTLPEVNTYYYEMHYNGEFLLNLSNNLSLELDGNNVLRMFCENNQTEVYVGTDLVKTYSSTPQELIFNLTTDSKVYKAEIITNDYFYTFNFGGLDITSFDDIIAKFAMLNIPEDEIRQRYLDIIAKEERDVSFSFNYIVNEKSQYVAKLDDFNLTLKKNRLYVGDEVIPLEQNHDWNNFRLTSKDDLRIYNNGKLIKIINKTFNSTPMLESNLSSIVTKNIVLKDGDYVENFDPTTCPYDNFMNMTIEDQIYVPYEYNGTLNFNISIDEPYDYAKVSLSIKNGSQDVYFWVMDI